jgi:hypothetical protein
LREFSLPIAAGFKQNPGMEKPPVPDTAMTPPQAYGMFLILLILVGGLSFYAGYLRPKKPVSVGPPPVTIAPRN